MEHSKESKAEQDRESKRFKIDWRRMTSTMGGLVILAMIIVCINIISSRVFYRLDVTQDRVFSLSNGSKKILEKIDDPVNITFFFSRSQKDLPVVFKTYATRVEEVLQEYARYGRGKVEITVVDPKPDTDDEEWARKYGIDAIPLPNGESLYFGVVLLKGTKEIAIPYFDPRREEFLEYDLSESIVRIMNKEKPRIGIISSLPIMGKNLPPQMMQEEQGGEAWAFVSELKKSFDVEEVRAEAEEISKNLKLLMVIHPKNLSQQTLYAIDQYVLGGGRLIVAVDPFCREDMAGQQQMMMSGQMPQVSSDLSPLFNAWGVEFHPDKIVGDLSHMTRIGAGGVAVEYPLFISLQKGSFSEKSIITGQLNFVLLAEPGELIKKEGSTFSFEPLLQTSADSGTVAAGTAALMQPQDIVRDLKPDQKVRTLAAHLTGKFKTAFPGGKPPKTSGDGADKNQTESASLANHLTESKEDTSVIIIADVDFIADNNAVDKFRFGRNVLTKLRNDNLPLLSNAADLLSGSQDLISIRSRGKIARPFTKVADIQKSAQLRWQKEEESLSGRLSELEKRLTEMQSQRTDGSRYALSSEQQREISKFRDEASQLRKRRREVRKNLREDIESLGYKLMAANMLVMPVIIGVFGFGVFYRRNHRSREK